MKRFILSFVVSILLCLFYAFSFNTNLISPVYACCSSTSTCACVNIPPGDCPGPNGEGNCISQLEVCTTNNPCNSSECCVNSSGSALCYALGSVQCGGGVINPTVHDGCSPHGLILKCGTPDPANFACKNSQGGCWGNWPGPVGQPTGGDCNTDHPRASNHTECQTNCWCESPCDPNVWSGWSACSTSCGPGTQTITNACGTQQSRSCQVNDPNVWGGWSACTGSPATHTRTNACGTAQTQNCTGVINARAMVIPDTNISCTAVTGSATGVPGTTMGFTAGSASSPARQPQSGSAYVSFAGIVGGMYTLAPLVSGGYYPQIACWKKAVNTPASGTGLSQTLSEPTNADTLTWDVGYTRGASWTQVVGGDAYAALVSSLPKNVLPAAPASYNVRRLRLN